MLLSPKLDAVLLGKSRLFVLQREECDKMKSQNGLLHMPDTSKQLGQVWTALSAAEKEVSNDTSLISLLFTFFIGL